MRIIRLQADNVLKLKAVDITPNGNVVVISGANGAGKSSVLNSIFFALGGKSAIPSKPVRKGQETATIRLNLGEVRVTRKIAANGNTEVIVEAESGARFSSPQRMLDELLGELSFDPLKFSLAEPKAQLETLRKLVPLEVDVDALDGQNARDYELRAEWNRKLRSLTERVATLGGGVDEAMDVTPIDVSALTAQITEAFEHNSAIERANHQRAAAAAKTFQLRSDIQGLEQELARIERRIAVAREALTEAEMDEAVALPAAELIDVSGIREQINEAGKINTHRERQVRQRENHAAAVRDLAEAREASQTLTDRMDTRTRQKRDAIAGAKMPVAGLSFGDGMVLYNDLPFDQASAAETIRVSFAIAMATNPKLKVVLIRDGSLLDERNLATIAEMADEHGYQVWLERVETDGKVGIVLEDGAVTAIDGVPVEHEQLAAL